jgi:hypothetical protein
LDIFPYRYQKFCSDIAGQHVVARGKSPRRAIQAVRDWMSDFLSGPSYLIPGFETMANSYKRFCTALPELCRRNGVMEKTLTFREYRLFAAGWIRAAEGRKVP